MNICSSQYFFTSTKPQEAGGTSASEWSETPGRDGEHRRSRFPTNSGIARGGSGFVAKAGKASPSSLVLAPLQSNRGLRKGGPLGPPVMLMEHSGKAWNLSSPSVAEAPFESGKWQPL